MSVSMYLLLCVYISMYTHMQVYAPWERLSGLMDFIIFGI
jgi:hypothetical protein